MLQKKATSYLNAVLDQEGPALALCSTWGYTAQLRGLLHTQHTHPRNMHALCCAHKAIAPPYILQHTATHKLQPLCQLLDVPVHCCT
jgi:hypothetical protein